MALAFTWLTPDFATSAQLTADDIAQAVAAGFPSGFQNRPDFQGGQSRPAPQRLTEARAGRLGECGTAANIAGGRPRGGKFQEVTPCFIHIFSPGYLQDCFF